MTVNFYLERRSDYDEKSSKRQRTGLTIILFIRFDGKLLKAGTGQKIHDRYWDKNTQRPVKDYPLYDSLKKFLDKWELEARRVELEADQPLSIEYLKKHLSFTRSHDGSFFKVWDEYRNKRSKKITHGTISAYNTAWKNLKVIDGSHPGLTDPGYLRYASMKREREYITKHKAYKLDFSTINEDFVNKLIDYCEFMGFTNRFCNQLLTRVKAFMNWAEKNEYIKNVGFRKLETELDELDTSIYFLMADELAHLTYMKIDSEKLERARDIWCFQAYTGLRYGDVRNFRKDYVIGDQYTLVQQKNKKKLTNELFEPAQKILEKYEDLPGPFALPGLSTANMNQYIKELAKLAGFDRRIILDEKRVGTEVKSRAYPLYSIIGTHTARKTFITYLINSGMNKNMVRLWTGQNADVIDNYFEILSDTKKRQAAILNKQFKKDAKKLRNYK